MLSRATARLATGQTGVSAPNVALSLLWAVLLCAPSISAAVDFNIDIQSSVGASASNASGGGPSRRVDCGSGTCAITTADDGILEYGIAASASIVKTGTSFTITAQGESELLQGSPYVTGTGDFIATIRIYAQTATSEQFVVKAVGNFKVDWEGLIPTSAGKAKTWFGTPCPDWGLNVESDASTPNGTVGPTIKSVRCVRTAAPPWNQIFEMTVDMKAAAGNKVVGENTSFNGKVDFKIQPKGKEMLKEDGDNQEALVSHALPDPIKVKVVQNDTDAPIAGVPIQFTVKDPDGNVVGNVLTAETQPDGIASVSGVILGSNPGTYTIEANCGQCIANQNVVFTATAEAIRTIIEKLPGAESGDRQKDRVGTQLPIPLRVRVKDTDGTLRAGVQVNFSVVDSPAAASFSDPNPVTDEMGVASTLFTLGGVAGHYEIEAFCSVCTGNAANGTASPANRAASSASGPTGIDDRVRLGQDADTEKVSDKLPGKTGPRASKGACFAEILQLPYDVPGVEEPAILRAPEPMLACAGSDVQLKCYGVHNVDSLSTTCESWGLVPNKPGAAVSQDDNSRAFFNSLLPEVFTVHVTRKTTLKPSLPGGTPKEVTCIAERAVSVAQVVLGDPTVSPFLGKQGEFNAAPRGAQFAVSVPVALQGVNVDLREYVRLTVAAYDMDGTLLAEQSERKKGWMVKNDVIHLNYTIPSRPENVFRLRIRIDACDSRKNVWFQVHPKVTFP